MLVLSRQKDQTIMIGDDVGITVVDIRGDKVRLGVTAPKSVAVHRREIYDSIRNENLRVATPSVGRRLRHETASKRYNFTDRRRTGTFHG